MLELFTLGNADASLETGRMLGTSLRPEAGLRLAQMLTAGADISVAGAGVRGEQSVGASPVPGMAAVS